MSLFKNIKGVFNQPLPNIKSSQFIKNPSPFLIYGFAVSLVSFFAYKRMSCCSHIQQRQSFLSFPVAEIHRIVFTNLVVVKQLSFHANRVHKLDFHANCVFLCLSHKTNTLIVIHCNENVIFINPYQTFALPLDCSSCCQSYAQRKISFNNARMNKTHIGRSFYCHHVLRAFGLFIGTVVLPFSLGSLLHTHKRERGQGS